MITWNQILFLINGTHKDFGNKENATGLPSKDKIKTGDLLMTFVAKNPYRVLRLRMAIPENFSDLVVDAMDYDGIYNPLTNNCLHFALRLLGLEPVPIPSSWTQQRDEEINIDDLEQRAALTVKKSFTTTWK